MNDNSDQSILKFAVNLLWVRPGQVGGTEVVIRQVLHGMSALSEQFLAILITTRDNADTFMEYTADSRFQIITAPVDSAGISKRIIWQNLHLNRFLKKYGLGLCFSPVYDRPLLNGGIRYITTIHDIQAYHYPHYHPLHEVLYSKLLWRVDNRFSVANICISEYVMRDIMEIYHFDPERMTIIYDPVSVDKDETVPFAQLREKYDIDDKGYFYTLSQLIPHKNIITLLRVIGAVIDRIENLPDKLLISGINGNAADEIRETIASLNLGEHVILTGYVNDAERNTLYLHSRAFLFSSVFEGFGIPPIEAMMLGIPVITTKCTCIPEITQGLANYVDDPYSIDDWIIQMKNTKNRSSELNSTLYDRVEIARKYLSFIRSASGRQ